MLAAEDLIVKLKDKGIKFEIMNEKEAIHYLEEHNYYVKVSSYRHDFKKNQSGEYIGLDFFHLKDLATVDMHLKFLILKMILNLEHSLKVNLLKDIEIEGIDDVKLTHDFLSHLGTNKGKTGYNIQNELFRRREKGYAGELLRKVEHPNYPIWIFIEVISFGTLVKLIKYYTNKYKDGDTNFANCDILFRVRDIRNASAHSNCLIHDLTEKRAYYLDGIYDFLRKKLNSYNGVEIKKEIRNIFIHDFICLLYAFNFYIKSDEIKQHRMEEVKNFFDIRVVRNKDKYLHNEMLINDYTFLKNVIDIFYV